MKKSLFLCFAASCLLVCSCTMLEILDAEDTSTATKETPHEASTSAKEDIPCVEEGPSTILNYYNSRWDHFTGALEEGKIYTYSNSKYDSRLRFTAFQVISKYGTLFRRPEEYSSGGNLCDEAIILVISNRGYADGATLHDGTYKCLGTYSYETKAEFMKTVYMLKEVKHDND